MVLGSCCGGGGKCGVVNTEETFTPIHSPETLIMWKVLLNLSLSHSFSLTISNPSTPPIPVPHLSGPSVFHHTRVDNYLNQKSLKL